MKKLPPSVHALTVAAGFLCLLAAYFAAFRGGPHARTRISETAGVDQRPASAAAAASAGEPVASAPMAGIAKTNAPRSPQAFSAKTAQTPQTLQIHEATSKLREWLNRYESAASGEREPLLAEGMHIARKRRSILLGMFASDPQGVLAHSLSFDEYARTPEELLPLVEKPFSTVADYTCVPVCPGGAALPPRGGQLVPNDMTLPDGDRLKVYTLGARREIGSKRELPVQGVALEGMAVMRDGVFQRVLPGEVRAVERMFESAQQNSSVSFATGKAIAGEPVRAVAGGKLFSFANEEELVKFDTAVASLDAKPGPQAASRLIFALPYQADGGAGGFNFEAAEFAAAAAAESWTCSPKRVFIIRVDFSDKAGEPIPKAAAESALAGSVATAVAEMSYGKTSISGTVSANVYRMPNPSTAYAGTLVAGSASFTSLNTDLLRDAKATFRQPKSGLDAGMNIGADDQSYGDFDVVGVYFADIGAYNAGVKYAGLASLGRGDLWMQGSNEPKVYVHEFGHIYGLGHSNFWLTTDQTSSVGAGAEKEYGDVYDVMGSGELPQGHFHPQAKHRLLWLSNNQCDLSETAEGIRTLKLYRIDSSIPVENPPTKLRGIRIPKATGEYYWIGYRGAYSDNPHLSRGAYLLWQRPGQLQNSEKCCLIDSLPATLGEKTDAALHVGRTYSDAASNPNAELHITPIGLGGTAGDEYIDLRINQGTFTGNNAPTVPSITLSGTLRARTEIVFQATATDADGDELAYFWSFSDGTVSGGTGASAASCTHSFIVGGSQTVAVTVSDMKGGVKTESTALDVYDPVISFTAGGSGSGTNGDLLGVATNGFLLVAVGTAGSGADKAVIRTSSDGVLWTSRSISESTPNLRLRAVHWSGERFVAVGTDYIAGGKWVGVIYTSENGASWTRRYTATQAGTGLHCVSSGNGSYVVGGEGGALLQSSNGLSWLPVDLLPVTHKVAGIACGAGTFVLTAHRYDSTAGYGEAWVYTSPDGRNWTDYTSGSGLSSSLQDFRAIAFLNDRFISSGLNSKFSVSNDGGKTFSTTRAGIEEMRAFSYYSGLYFASGLETIGSGSLESKKWVHMYSVDGTKWTKADAGFSGVAGAVVFGSRIVNVCEGGIIKRSEPMISRASNSPPVASQISIPQPLSARSVSQFTVSALDADGDGLTYNWDAGDGFGVGTGSTFNYSWLTGGSYDLSVTVSDGSGQSVRQKSTVFVDDPLKRFEQRSVASNPLNAIAASGSLLVAVGEYGEIQTSADGQTWQNKSIPPPAGYLGSNIHFQGVTWDGSRFVAVGQDHDSTAPGTDYVSMGVVYVSNDGISWMRVHNSVSGGTIFQTVAASSGTILVGDNLGKIFRSANGTSWSQFQNPYVQSGTYLVGGLAYGAGTFALTAHTPQFSGSGAVLTSTRGEQSLWTDRSGILRAEYPDVGYVRQISYANDRFVASGYRAKLWVSNDGGVSFRAVLSQDREAASVVYGAGVYFGISKDYEFVAPPEVQSPVSFFSVDGERWVQTDAQSILAKSKAATFFKNRFFVVGQGGSIATSGTVETALTPPSIVVQPAGGRFDESKRITLYVEAGGSPPLSYQWMKDGSEIPDASSKFYVVSSAALVHAGTYKVRVSGVGGHVESRTVSVDVVPSPLVLSHKVMAGGSVKVDPTESAAYYSSSRLPPGLFLNRSTGVISGTAFSAGDYTVRIRGFGSDRKLVYAKEIKFQIKAFSPTLTGQYVGLVDKNADSALKLDLSARLDFAVSSSGRVSGRVSSPHGRATFLGTLQTTISEPEIARGTFSLNFGEGPNTRLFIELNGNGQAQTLVGSITAVGAGTSAAVSGWRNPWESKQATSFAGRYHFYLQNAKDANIPLGYGYGAAIVSRFRGGVMLWGRLPDSSGISSSSFLSENGEVLAYSSLYSGSGSCLGVLAIEKSGVPPRGNSIENSSGKPLVWSKNQAGLRDLKIAPPQFTGVELGIQGGIFSFSDSMISRARLAVSNAGSLSFIPASTESVTSTFGQTVSLYPVGGVQVRAIVPSNTAQVSLTPMSPFDGLFSGTFSVPPVPPDTIPYPARFSGQIVNIGTQSIGYGFFLAPANSSSAFSGSLISGTVTLSRP